ncbi:MAG: cobalamin biosynthesis protein CbiM, partial [Caldimicrobium sp.]
DEAVIEKLAEERGKKSKPLFELEGDLELFMFSLLFGISGFAAGYYWRKLFSEKKDVATTS